MHAWFLYRSNPEVPVIDQLSRLSHDGDQDVAQSVSLYFSITICMKEVVCSVNNGSSHRIFPCPFTKTVKVPFPDMTGCFHSQAILGLGFISAGTNNSRVAQLLRQLSEFYSREAGPLFCTRLAQGLNHMGKGLLTINPFHG